MIWDIAFSKRLQHGSARFDLQLALRSDAQRLVLFGPSGAGKTQSLKIMAGLVTADGGHVRIAGRTLYDAAQRIVLTPQQRRLGYVFQDYALFPHLTVRQNIAFATRSGWRNPPRQLQHAAVERWLDNFQLRAVADLQPQQISGGQRQRTALARALVNEPTALLLDEPFAALDRPLRRSLRSDLAALLRELRIPMLLITHDDEDVQALADQVVQLQAGRVVDGAQGDGAPLLRSHPAAV